MANETNKLTFGGVTYQLEDHRISSIVDAIYPVGSIYMSVNAANPATLFGGTWEQIKGRFLIGTGTPDDNTNTFYGTDLTYDGTNKYNEMTPGSTGGEARHTLAYGEMPEHAHYSMGKTAEENGDWTFPLMKSIPNYAGAWGFHRNADSVDYVVYAVYAVDGHGYPDVTQVAYTGASGNSQAHNNLPPYFVVNMWKRTA